MLIYHAFSFFGNSIKRLTGEICRRLYLSNWKWVIKMGQLEAHKKLKAVLSSVLGLLPVPLCPAGVCTNGLCKFNCERFASDIEFLLLGSRMTRTLYWWDQFTKLKSKYLLNYLYHETCFKHIFLSHIILFNIRPCPYEMETHALILTAVRTPF
jgi:hypothetical protein